MKTSRLFTIDVEVAERLVEEDNASKLVNEMLVDHYETVRPTGQSDKDRLVVLKKRLAKEKLTEKHKQEMEKLNG